MGRLDHPNIVKFYESIDTSDYVYLVMEHLPGISLLRHLKNQHERRLKEPEIKRMFKQLMEALAYLHSLNITH